MNKGLIVALAFTLIGVGFAITGESSAQTPYPSCPTTSNACKANDISTNTTTTVKSGAGFLHTLTINTKGASSNVLTVYDNTAGSGTKIATIDTTTGVTTLTFDVGFATGLTIVTATGTAADVTVSYI